MISHVKPMRVYKHLGFLNSEPLRMTAFLKVGGKVLSTEVNGWFTFRETLTVLMKRHKQSEVLIHAGAWRLKDSN